MSESYVLVGHESGRLLTGFWLLSVLVPYTVLWLRGGRRPNPFVPVALTIWISGGYFASLPMEWTLGGSILVLGLAIPFLKFKDSAKSIRWILAPAFVGLGIALSLMSTYMERGTITLSGDRMFYSDFMSRGVVPRSGLKIDATNSNGRDWYSWTTFSGDELGPSLSGFNIYLGPHGLTTGDEVGQRLAQWSGTKPRFTSLVLP